MRGSKRKNSLSPEISILGDLQNAPVQGPEQCDLALKLSFLWGTVWMSWTLEIPPLLNYSMILRLSGDKIIQECLFHDSCSQIFLSLDKLDKLDNQWAPKCSVVNENIVFIQVKSNLTYEHFGGLGTAGCTFWT